MRQRDFEIRRRQRRGAALGPLHQHQCGIIGERIEAEIVQFRRIRDAVQIQMPPGRAIGQRIGLDGFRHAGPLQLNALACVALPTCGLAMAEAERYLPALLEKIQTLLHRHGLGSQPVDLRISGCPNGCSRPYLSEIALIGRAPGRYNLMLGGDHLGQRLNSLYGENLSENEILDALDPLLARYARNREPAERLGDYLTRTGSVKSLPRVRAEATSG